MNDYLVIQKNTTSEPNAVAEKGEKGESCTEEAAVDRDERPLHEA